MSALKRAFYNSFYIDYRSMALFRIMIGVAVILDLMNRSTDLTIFYTDFGVLQREDVLAISHPLRFSLHNLFGRPSFIAVMFFIHGVIAALFALGWRTRLMGVLLFIFTISLQNRNFHVLNSGDTVLRVFLFWAYFLPLGRKFSIDNALSKDTPPANSGLLSVGTFIILGQLMTLYISAFLLKTGREWYPDFTATYYALSIDQFTTFFGEWLIQFYDLLKVLTLGVYIWEGFGPLVAMSPFFTRYARVFSFLAFSGMHIGFSLSLKIGLFSYIAISCWTLILPSEFWDWLGKKLKKENLDTTIYYDEGCNFCLKMVLIIKEFLGLNHIPHKTIQDKENHKDVMKIFKNDHSWVVGQNGEFKSRFAGFLALVDISPTLAWKRKILNLGFVKSIGDYCYRFVASKRSFGSRISSRYLLREESLWDGKMNYLSKAFCLFTAMVCLCWVLKNHNIETVKFSGFWRDYIQVFRLDQGWNMFAPYPLKYDGWFVVEGKMENGEKVDVWHKKLSPPSFEKPEDVSGMYPNQRWRKYMMNLRRKSSKNQLRFLGHHWCREWNKNKKYGDRLKEFNVFYMREETLLNYKVAPIHKRTVWTHWCFGEKAK